MKRKTKPVYFNLTIEQLKILKPLFNAVDKHAAKNKPGAIVCQLFSHGQCNAMFFPNKEAGQMIEISKKYFKDF